MFKKILTGILNKLFTPVLIRIDQLESPEYVKLIRKAYNAGYNYHQKTAKKDPELMAWIGRECYFDNKDII